MHLYPTRHRFLPALLLLSALGVQAQETESEAELLARAKAIHGRVITLDTHKDIFETALASQTPKHRVPSMRYLIVSS